MIDHQLHNLEFTTKVIITYTTSDINMRNHNDSVIYEIEHLVAEKLEGQCSFKKSVHQKNKEL
jgi:hypothetical protein